MIGVLAAGVATASVAALLWHRRHPRPFPVSLATMLESPIRRLTLVPERLAAQLDLATGATVLEVGPGGGAITAALLAHPARPLLICADIQAGMLSRIRDRFSSLADRAPLLVCSDGAAQPLSSGSVDCVVLVTVLGEIPDRAGALRECARVLRPGGVLAVTETLPDPDFLPASVVSAEARAAGFEPSGESPVPVGALVGAWGAYTLQFRRP